MAGNVERVRLPELKSVQIASDSDVQAVLIPVDCVKFEVFLTTENVTGYWAVSQGQVLEATGDRRTIPSGERGGVSNLKLRENATLYLAASAQSTIEVVIYNRA